MLRILRDMEKAFGRYYYLREDLRAANPGMNVAPFKKVKDILGQEVAAVKDYDGVKLICKNGDWLMFRGSGTEPIMRVYAESTSLNKTKKILALGKKLVLKK